MGSRRRHARQYQVSLGSAPGQPRGGCLYCSLTSSACSFLGEFSCSSLTNMSLQFLKYKTLSIGTAKGQFAPYLHAKIILIRAFLDAFPQAA